MTDHTGRHYYEQSKLMDKYSNVIEIEKTTFVKKYLHCREKDFKAFWTLSVCNSTKWKEEPECLTKYVATVPAHLSNCTYPPPDAQTWTVSCQKGKKSII